MSQTLSTAQLTTLNGVPYSTQFGDVYFSSDDGIAESEYNFLQGNELSQRWQQLDSQQFTIAETGFGSGLNFLLTASLWQESQAAQYSSLHYISVEKHPIDKAELARLYQQQNWQNDITEALIEHYPMPWSGQYHLCLSPQLTLTLLLGDATEQFSGYEFIADAWYLDGFSPNKNADLWSEELFRVMAKRSKVGTTFATFTAASAIRRGLLSAGFAVRKEKGFGRKRERLLGQFIAEE